MELDLYLRFVLAFGFTIALMIGIYWVVKRFGNRTILGRMTVGRRSSVVEVAPVDPRRKLVLVRRDDVEHLLLLGTQGETVIETGIKSAPNAFADALVGETGSGNNGAQPESDR